jgi:hypothetical protein
MIVFPIFLVVTLMELFQAAGGDTNYQLLRCHGSLWLFRDSTYCQPHQCGGARPLGHVTLLSGTREENRVFIGCPPISAAEITTPASFSGKECPETPPFLKPGVLPRGLNGQRSN